MPDETGRFQWVVTLARIAMFGMLVLLALALTATGAMIVITALEPGHWFTLAQWILLIVAELIAIVAAFVGYGLVRILAGTVRAGDSAAARLSRVETLLVDQAESAKKLIDIAGLSDQAKSLLFREREIEAFREIVQEDVMRQDYQTAEALIDTVEKRLGYADEAARLRDELSESKKATLDEKIDAAVGRIQSFIDRCQWAQATRAAERIMRLFPDNPKIASLPERIESGRAAHKRDVLQQYDEAVRKNDVDEGIKLLKELDLYLTPQEAAAYKESARGVFKARLHQLGVQFAIRVADQQWDEAIRAGQDIIREFPNSRMAEEVREKMDVLRSYAEASAQAELPGRPATPQQEQ